jgi:hypothetical protein
MLKRPLMKWSVTLKRPVIAFNFHRSEAEHG